MSTPSQNPQVIDNPFEPQPDLSAGLKPKAQVTQWSADGTPITSWDANGKPIDLSAGMVPIENPFDTPPAPPQQQQDTGGFFSHLWDSVNPGKIISNIGSAIQNPKQTYLNDEAARVKDFDSAKNRASQIVHSNASFGKKATGLVDTGAQALADLIPFVGTAANHAADTINSGNAAGGVGDAVGLGLTLATPEVLRGAGTVAKSAVDTGANIARTAKNAITVSRDLTNAAAVPVRSVADIQAGALPDLASRAGKVIDDAAANVSDAAGNPIDTTGISGLSDKAAFAGDAYKQAGSRVYKQLDNIANQVAPGKGWAFQKLTTDVNTLKEIIDDPETPLADKAGYEQQLTDAQGRLDQFSTLAEQAGIPNVKVAIAQGNKLYSTGLHLEETARGIARNERIVVNPDGSITRVLKNNNFPLDAAIRQITDTARPRGHVLASAVGKEGAAELQRAVADAANQIQQGKVANSAAKAAKTAAQDRIKTIRGRQVGIAKDAIKIGGAGYVGAKAFDALYGRKRTE